MVSGAGAGLSGEWRLECDRGVLGGLCDGVLEHVVRQRLRAERAREFFIANSAFWKKRMGTRARMRCVRGYSQVDKLGS